MTAVFGDVNFTDAGAHAEPPKGMGELVAEHIGANRARKNQQEQETANQAVGERRKEGIGCIGLV
ncbi:MAG: hypothetical protein CBE26_00195 [Kiritimatiellaceae bacterium TMED266]|nr:MAG: hypothetical protein CBE26_00195 [Kiritimatiellaceae bacterium TMED266]